MRRRDLLKLAGFSAALMQLLDMACQRQNSANFVGENAVLSKTMLASQNTIAAISVDWATQQSETTPLTFGSNDYEITSPIAARNSVYQSRLAQLGIGLIRIHCADLSDRWTNPVTKTWDEAKIKAGYDASYPQRPTIIQNIPGWPKWMVLDQDGLLAHSEYDHYATFCAELVEILNRRQGRQITYWEPLNEQDVAYQKAGKLNELWTIYNKVAMAMKVRDPTIKVGGPALTWNEPGRLAAFLQACGPNVDFISWHRYASGDAHESTDSLMSYTPKYGTQVQEFRALAQQYIPDRKVPLLLGEYNINYSWQSGEQRQNTHIGAVWFASVHKHLAESGIDMATSWHLKDGIYGLIDPQNNLRPAATVFAWGIKYLTGRVMRTQSDHPFVEAVAVIQTDGGRSLLLINKSAQLARLKVQAMPDIAPPSSLQMFYLDANGVKKLATQATAALKQKPLFLAPYSLLLLRFSATGNPSNNFGGR